jgi:hypothetical protein
MISMSIGGKLDHYLEAGIPDLTSRLTENVHAVLSKLGMLQPGFVSAELFAGHGKSQNQKLGSPTHSSDTFPSPFSPATAICFVLRLA